jgi:hypothetical protein
VKPSGRSVRKTARRLQTEALELPRHLSVYRAAISTSTWFGRTEVVVGAPAALAIAILFLPNWVSISAIRQPADARSFLSTLWQVEAGTIALSLSLILVAFETIWRGRFRGSTRRFADEVLLLYAVSLAFSSLIVIGCTLLGLGTAAPGGWAATWSVLLSAGAFAVVPIVLVRTLMLMNPATAHQRRIQQVRREVHDAVDAEVFERLAFATLKNATESTPGLDLAPMLSASMPEGHRGIRARVSGSITDIDIGRLRRIAKRRSRRSAGSAVLTICVHVGEYVRRGDTLAFATDDLKHLIRRQIGRAFTISTDESRSRLYDVIGHIHEEALRAIRDVQPSTYDDIAELWTELLAGFPEAWQGYSHPYDEGAAGEFSRFGVGPVDAVARSLFAEAREATRSMPDIAAAAFGVPDIVIYRTADQDAPALLLRMLALYVELYPVAAAVADETLRDRLLHLVLELPAQQGRRIEHQFREYDLPHAEHDRVDLKLRIVFRALMEQLKAIADRDPADVERIDLVNRSWSEVFSGWSPEYDKEDLWPGLSEAEELRRQERNAQVDRVAAKRDELDQLRDAYRFAVVYWALNRLQETSNVVWLSTVEAIAPWLGSPTRIAAAVDRVIQLDLDQRVFLGWHQRPVQMAWAAPRALAILVLLRQSPNEIPPDLGRCDFVRGGMAQEIGQIVEAVGRDRDLWRLLGGAPPNLAERVVALSAAIDASSVMP